MQQLTHILQRMESGDAQAASELMPLVYNELRKLATARLAQEKPGHTLQATALVHEAYLRLVGEKGQSNWDNRGHFFAAAAEAMRRILVDAARGRNALKRGGALARQELQESQIIAPEIKVDLVALDEALTRLEQADADAARLVKLRYFAGMTMEEAAEALDISVRSAYRTWDYAKAWLHRELAG